MTFDIIIAIGVAWMVIRALILIFGARRPHRVGGELSSADVATAHRRRQRPR